MLEGLNPLWLLVNLPNMSSAHVAIQLRAKGPNSTIMSDWAAGSQAIGEAFDWIRCGEADAVLAGGADSGLNPFVYTDYQAAGLFEPPAADGSPPARFVPAEGAAILLLEEREHARRRGAAIRGEVRAYAAGSAPIGDGGGGALAATMCGAMADAEWTVDEIDAVSTASVFAAPYQALERSALATFPGAPDRPRRTEVTSRIGHALGAAGAIDAALSIALGRGARLCSTIGFSGQAVTLAFQDHDQPEASRT
jgi:3-oxoacyl-[acyl-carrier-protein] synthase II